MYLCLIPFKFYFELIYKGIPLPKHHHLIYINLEYMYVCTLHYTGHPIMNDPLYNHPVWQNLRGKGAVAELEKGIAKDETRGNGEGGERGTETASEIAMEHIVKQIIQSKFTSSSCASGPTSSGSVKNSSPPESGGEEGEASVGQGQGACTSIPPDSEKEGTKPCTATPQTPVGHSVPARDPDCTECRQLRDDPLPTDLVMYLHALSYKVVDLVYPSFLLLNHFCKSFLPPFQGDGWSFSAPIPAWATPDWTQ